MEVNLNTKVVKTHDASDFLLYKSLASVKTLVVDLASVPDADILAQAITVTGAALGDFVLVSINIDVADLTVTADVTAADTVTVLLNNNTGAPVDLASATIKVMVIKAESAR